MDGRRQSSRRTDALVADKNINVLAHMALLVQNAVENAGMALSESM